MSAGTRVAALRRRLGDELALAFDAASGVEEPAGTSEGWAAVCTRWDVSPLGDAERAEVRAALRPLRGAPVPELSAVVDAIARAVRVEARKVSTFDATREDEAAHERLLRLIERVPSELITAYRGAVLPRRRGMFDNVMRHHDPAASAAAGGASTSTLRCRTCGAPRLRQDDFQCAFCDGQMI